jgi:CRISPR-associated protein Csb1
MEVKINSDLLRDACADDSEAGGLVINSEIEPLGGSGAPVKPAVYPGMQFQLDKRWVGEGENRSITDVVVIDNVPSQANRLEAALEKLAPTLGLPMIVLNLSKLTLPAHLPNRLTSFLFPHRQADAYLRDSSTQEGVAFADTDIGRSILSATADNPLALFQWFPQALLFGFWQSHLGKKGSQAKLARSWVSEIVGVGPASVETRTLGIKGDPLNLNVDGKIVYDPDFPSGWEFQDGGKKKLSEVETKKSGGSRKQDSLSNIGHGQIPFKAGDEALSAVSFKSIKQRSILSLPGLRRICCDSPEKNAAGRALLAAIGIVGHVAAFGRPFSLRSGCDLRVTSQRWQWLGDSEQDVEPLNIKEAINLLQSCAESAEAAGLPVGSVWKDSKLELVASASLKEVIKATYPVGE